MVDDFEISVVELRRYTIGSLLLPPALENKQNIVQAIFAVDVISSQIAIFE